MKLELLKDVFRMGVKGDVIEVRTQAQADMYVENGSAKMVKESKVSEEATTETAPETLTTTNTVEPVAPTKTASKTSTKRK